MTQQTHNTLLLVDDEVTRREALQTILAFLGYKVRAIDEAHFLQHKITTPYLGMLLGEPSHFSRIEKHLLQQSHCLPIILINFELPQACSELMRHVYMGSMRSPFYYQSMLCHLHACQHFWESLEASGAQHSALVPKPFKNMIGVSESMKQVFHLMRQVSGSDVTVLILGESGTGKEIVAQNLHQASTRKDKPFVPVNCGAIPADLLESELFGHEKGAFTGAISTRQGRFELAKGGTIFLDEIGDMPLPMQVKLLRVLQERCFERVGSNKSIQTDVRIIAATNCNLEDLIEQGKFREDLYYRLNVFPIDLPSLRARSVDIPLLIDSIVHEMNQERQTALHLLPEAIEALTHYPWPGNVRELVNLMERLAILYPNGVVSLDDLPEKFRTCPIGGAIAPETFKTAFDFSNKPEENELEPSEAFTYENLHVSQEGVDLKEHLAKTELALIRQALDESNGVVAKAASFLHMRRTTLVEKMRKYGISKEDCTM